MSTLDPTHHTFITPEQWPSATFPLSRYCTFWCNFLNGEVCALRVGRSLNGIRRHERVKFSECHARKNKWEWENINLLSRRNQIAVRSA